MFRSSLLGLTEALLNAKVLPGAVFSLARNLRHQTIGTEWREEDKLLKPAEALLALLETYKEINSEVTQRAARVRNMIDNYNQDLVI